MIKEKDRIIIQKELNLVLRYFNDSGIRSSIEIHIMTPLANEQAADMMLFCFLILINIGINPIKVATPAKEVRIKGYNI